MSFIFNNNVKYEGNEQLDAFGRLRTSGLTTFFESPLKHHEEKYLWDTELTGTGTYSYSFTHNMLTASVSTNGDKVLRQTKQYIQLQNGKSHLGFIGVVFGSAETDVIKRTGVFDDDNGFYIKQEGNGDISFVIRSKASGTVQESVLPQSSWNIDRLDGTGKSGINVDFTKLQVLAFDMSYSGNGSIRFGLMIDNKIVYAHQSSSFNLYAVKTFTTPGLPLQYEIESVGGSGSMKQQSCCVMVEGTYEERGVQRTINTGTTATSVGTTLTPVLSLQLKSNYRKALLVPKSFNILQTSTNTTLYYAVYMYNTLTNASWTASQTGTDCIAQYDTSATALSGGIIIDSGYIPAKATTTISEQFTNILTLAGDIAGNTDILTIAIAGIGGTVPCFVSVNYYEIY